MLTGLLSVNETTNCPFPERSPVNSTQVDGPAARRCRTPFPEGRAEAGAQTTLRSGTDWRGRESALQHSLYSDGVGVAPDPDIRLMNRRCATLGHRVAQLKARGRTPRVCLYALTADSQGPVPGLDKARALAVREGWQVGAEQVFVDDYGPSIPATRSGWVAVQRQVRSGFADGVVALTPSAIAPCREEYESQLRWFTEHFGFIALVHAEVAEVLR